MASIDFQANGAADSNADASVLSPGAPAGVVSGNLLVLPTWCRGGLTAPAAPTGWLQIGNVANKMRVFGRIADGSGDDTPTLQWTGGSNDTAAVIQRFDGDVPADINDLVPAGGETVFDGTGGVQSLPMPAATAPTGTDFLVWGGAKKNKTSATNGADITVTPEFTERFQLVGTGTENMAAIGDWQQVGSGANYDGDDWTHDVGNDALASAGIILYFLPEESGAPAPGATTPLSAAGIVIGP